MNMNRNHSKNNKASFSERQIVEVRAVMMSPSLKKECRFIINKTHNKWITSPVFTIGLIRNIILIRQ